MKNRFKALTKKSSFVCLLTLLIGTTFPSIGFCQWFHYSGTIKGSDGMEVGADLSIRTWRTPPDNYFSDISIIDEFGREYSFLDIKTDYWPFNCSYYYNWNTGLDGYSEHDPAADGYAKFDFPDCCGQASFGGYGGWN